MTITVLSEHYFDTWIANSIILKKQNNNVYLTSIENMMRIAHIEQYMNPTYELN